MIEHDIAANQVVIVDDAFDMGPLAPRFVRISPLNGLDDRAIHDILTLFPS